MNDYKQAYDMGSKSAVLDCINSCFIKKKTVPEWCQLAFIDAMQAVYSYKVGCWGDLFGRMHPKYTNLESKRSIYSERMAVHEAVENAKANGESVNRTLFEKVGRQLGIGSKTKVEGHYYFVRDVNLAILIFDRIHELIEGGAPDGPDLISYVSKELGVRKKKAKKLYQLAKNELYNYPK